MSVKGRNDFGSDLRRMSSGSVTSKKVSTKRRRKSLKKNLQISINGRNGQLTVKESKRHRTLLSRMLKSNGHKAKVHGKDNATRNHSDKALLVGPSKNPAHHRQSLLMRVHTRFFSKRKKLRSIYDLPDLSNLADCNFTKEYETPRECFHRFEKTPLIGRSLVFLSPLWRLFGTNIST